MSYQKVYRSLNRGLKNKASSEQIVKLASLIGMTKRATDPGHEINHQVPVQPYQPSTNYYDTPTERLQVPRTAQPTSVGHEIGHATNNIQRQPPVKAPTANETELSPEQQRLRKVIQPLFTPITPLPLPSHLIQQFYRRKAEEREKNLELEGGYQDQRYPKLS